MNSDAKCECGVELFRTDRVRNISFEYEIYRCPKCFKTTRVDF